MCGITGILTTGAPVEAEALGAMARRLAHRGPDDQGQFVEGPLGLAHNRLSIIDLCGGHQPIADCEAGLVLIANGEIYNYLELNEELARLGQRFDTHSDSETILRAYAAWGLDFLPRLNGMFAFALYDRGRGRGRLILARDRLGIKPLYVLRRPDRLLFGSELKALLPACPAPELVPEALAQYLAYDYSSGPDTLVRGIQRVLPGQALIVERDLSARTLEYWSPLSVKPQWGSYEDFAVEFESLMDRVMREHLRADVPFGLFLSGGVDSSLLLAQIARRQDRPVRSFSVGFAGTGDAGELPAAEAAARRYSAEHTPLLLEPDALLRRLPHTVWAADDLILDAAMLPTSLLAQAAGQHCKVVFTGEGGDEVFAGYGRYRHPAAARALRALLAPGTGGFRTGTRWSWRESRKVYGPQLWATRGTQRVALASAWSAAPPGWTALMRAQYTDMKTMLADQLCPKMDRMLMAFGVEGRVPWLDHRVVEFGLALPDSLKIAPHQGKLFLKRWGRQFFPAEHLDQRKRGFSVPVHRFLSGSLLDDLARRLPRHPALQPWFRPAGIAGLIHRQKTAGNATHELWALLQIALWHRIFIEGDGSPPPLDADPAEWWN
jgi:asparagine synthase (glutamine-hydrolysing)